MKQDKRSRQTAMDYRQRVCRAMDYISRNLDRDLSLEEIAEAAAFSMFHFHRIFKAMVGETVAEFTRRLRLEQAATRLSSTREEDVTTIAIDYGFSSSQNFAKAFRRHFGMTPTAYRNSKIGHTNRKEENAFSLRASYDSDVVLTDSMTNEGSCIVKAKIKEMPEFHVAYIRKMGPYNKETAGQAFGELAQWAGPRGHLESGTVLGVYWDNPEVTPPEKCRLDACISVPEGSATDGPVNIQTISGGSYAVCNFEIKTERFQKAWDDAFAWFVKNGYECDEKPCYERYHNDAANHPEGKWIVDICIPLKQAN